MLIVGPAAHKDLMDSWARMAARRPYPPEVWVGVLYPKPYEWIRFHPFGSATYLSQPTAGVIFPWVASQIWMN
jgi:hypothetical protein